MSEREACYPDSLLFWEAKACEHENLQTGHGGESLLISMSILRQALGFQASLQFEGGVEGEKETKKLRV